MTAVELGAKNWVERARHCTALRLASAICRIIPSPEVRPDGGGGRLRSARQRASPQLARQPLAGGRLAPYCTAHGIFGSR